MKCFVLVPGPGVGETVHWLPNMVVYRSKMSDFGSVC